MNNVELARILEFMPRTLQLMVSLKSSEVKDPDLSSLLDIDKASGIDITKNAQCNLPPLSSLESGVSLSTFESGAVYYSLLCPYIGVGPKDTLHVVAPSYMRLRDFAMLVPWQTETHYTPTVLRYAVSYYDREANIGRAVISIQRPLILTGEDNSTLYEYRPQDVGVKVLPTVEEAYLVR